MLTLMLALFWSTAGAVEVDPDVNAEAWAYQTRGDYLASARLAAARIEADPTDATAHRAWATAMAREDYMGNEGREEMYRAWIEDQPDNLGLKVGLLTVLSTERDEEARCKEGIALVEQVPGDRLYNR